MNYKTCNKHQVRSLLTQLNLYGATIIPAYIKNRTYYRYIIFILPVLPESLKLCFHPGNKKLFWPVFVSLSAFFGNTDGRERNLKIIFSSACPTL